MLEGEYQFLVGGDTLRAKAGSLLYIPKGVRHTHKNLGEWWGRVLLTQIPGGFYEMFFEKVGRIVEGDDGGAPDIEERPDARRRIVELAAEHGGTEIPTSVAE